MPDEPTNGSARARRRHGLPPRASALVLLAFSLFVLSGIVYVQSIPSLLTAPEQSVPAGEQDEPGSEGHGDVNQGQSGSDAGAADQGYSGTRGQGERAAPGGRPAGHLCRGRARAGRALRPQRFGRRARRARRRQRQVPRRRRRQRASLQQRRRASRRQRRAGQWRERQQRRQRWRRRLFSSSPTPEEEAAFHAFLAGKASAVTGYVSQANACAADFESSCRDASLPARRESRQTCASLSQRLFSEYIAVRDYVRSNYSQYCDEQERLIGAYRCLASYAGR